jgi:predicted lipoprotein with Yx(FWY)xxD motif
LIRQNASNPGVGQGRGIVSTQLISKLPRLRLAVVLAAPALLVAACGGSSGSGSAQGGGGSAYGAGTSVHTATVVETHSSDLGTYLTDGSGRTVYLFAADHGNTSTCNGSCASAWPPVRVKGSAKATGDAKASMLRTITRSDGSKQVTYAGHPLYYFAGDRSAGDLNGQGSNGFGAKWWVVSPSGKAIPQTSGGSTPAPSASSSGSGSSGGSGGGWG